MDKDAAEAITAIEQQLAERDVQLAERDEKIAALEVAHKALALKVDAVDEWIERVNLAFVKELGK